MCLVGKRKSGGRGASGEAVSERLEISNERLCVGWCSIGRYRRGFVGNLPMSHFEGRGQGDYDCDI